MVICVQCGRYFDADIFLTLTYTEAVENWRKQKLEEVKLAVVKGTSNSIIPHDEEGMNKILCSSLPFEWVADTFRRSLFLYTLPMNAFRI